MTKWVLKTENGEINDPKWSIFPLVSHDTPGRPFRVIGTAFMVARPGLFFTARHCLYKDNANSEVWGDLIGLLDHPYRMKWTTVLECSDVAIGQLDLDEFPSEECRKHAIWKLCKWTPVEAELICHFGCESTDISVESEAHPDYHLNASMAVTGHSGHFLQTESRYRPFTERSVHFTSASVPHSASGGPVMQSNGFVVGITTSSSDGGGYSVASLIKDALNARVPAQLLNGDKTSDALSFSEVLKHAGVEILRGD